MLLSEAHTLTLSTKQRKEYMGVTDDIKQKAQQIQDDAAGAAQEVKGKAQQQLGSMQQKSDDWGTKAEGVMNEA